MSITELTGNTGTLAETIFDPAPNQTYPLLDSTAEFARVCLASIVDTNLAQIVTNQKTFRRMTSRERSRQDQQHPTQALAGDNGIHCSLGFWYLPGTLLFTRSTAIRQTIIFPDSVGGGSNQYLYLTATNRSEKGVESHIAFKAQDSAHFFIYDWSLNANQGSLACDLPISSLSRFLFLIEIDGVKRNSISLINETRLLSDTTWNNRVHLAAYLQGQLDHFETIYSSTYTLECNAQQNSNSNGYWGPEVESFQNYSEPINALGFTATWLIQDEFYYPLGEANTYLHADMNGLQLIYQTPARDFLVD